MKTRHIGQLLLNVLDRGVWLAAQGRERTVSGRSACRSARVGGMAAITTLAATRGFRELPRASASFRELSGCIPMRPRGRSLRQISVLANNWPMKTRDIDQLLLNVLHRAVGLAALVVAPLRPCACQGRGCLQRVGARLIWRASSIA
jgi:hypothetical protein